MTSRRVRSRSSFATYISDRLHVESTTHSGTDARAGELLHRGTDVAAREVQLLAQFDRRGAMTHAEEQQVHQNVWLVGRRR